jgi:hypothetical protein
MLLQPKRRQPGRPSHNLRQSRNSPPPTNIPHATSQLIQPTTPPKKSKKKDSQAMQYSPHTARAVTFSMQVPIWKIDESPETNQRSRHRSSDSSLRTLNHVKHDENEGWRSLGKTKTEKLFKLFEEWV